MEIRKNSWHYWLYEAPNDRQAPQHTNLCRYFWRVVGGALFVAIIFTICASIVVGIGVMFYLHTFGMFIAVGALALLSLSFYLYWHFQEKAWKRQNVPGYQEPEPGLLRSYLRAKKDKVCPIVTFVDTE